jgi:site-specific recombinase XerD
MNTDMNGVLITVEDFRQECLHALEEKGKLNTISTVLVNNIASLYETAIQCRENIVRNGVMIETIGSTGQPIVKKNEAVPLQEKNIATMAKLLGQLELDNIVAKVESAF